MTNLNGHMAVPTATGTGGFDPNHVFPFQLWEDSTGQVWLAEMGTDGIFVTTSIQPRITEDGRFRVTEGGRLRITET